MKNASSQSELLEQIKSFGQNANELMNQAAKRQQELKDPQLRDDLAAARAVLKKHSTMLLTASKVSNFLKHTLQTNDMTTIITMGRKQYYFSVHKHAVLCLHLFYWTLIFNKSSLCVVYFFADI